MEAQLINKYQDATRSFSIGNHCFNNFLKVWHYHPEIELVVILESTGTRFVGDSIEKFEPGDIVLLGKGLPHLWQNDKAYFEPGNTAKARAGVIHIQEKFTNMLSQLPEMTGICHLFQKAKRGIRFNKQHSQDVIKMIQQTDSLTGFKQMMGLLDLLHYLSHLDDSTLLASEGYLETFKAIKASKILKVHEYIMNNFKNDISLEEVANVANMNPSAFSRYFKTHHKQTFSSFLNEVRIGYACKLLIEEKYNITGVCYEAGFNNLSNFNRKFKAYKQITPTEYLKLYAKASKE